VRGMVPKLQKRFRLPDTNLEQVSAILCVRQNLNNSILRRDQNGRSTADDNIAGSLEI